MPGGRRTSGRWCWASWWGWVAGAGGSTGRNKHLKWRQLVSLSCALSVCWLVAVFRCPDSPRTFVWYIFGFQNYTINRETRDSYYVQRDPTKHQFPLFPSRGITISSRPWTENKTGTTSPLKFQHKLCSGRLVTGSKLHVRPPLLKKFSLEQLIQLKYWAIEPT